VRQELGAARQIARYRERDRDNRRHPKKYYAARLLLQGGPGAEQGAAASPTQ